MKADRCSRPTVELELSGSIPAPSREVTHPMRWHTLFEKRWRWPTEHINPKEGRVSLIHLRRLARNKRCHGHKALYFGDNLVTLSSFDKGRAKAWSINALCRRSAAYQLGCGIRWRGRHIRSERNVADAGSQLKFRSNDDDDELLKIIAKYKMGTQFVFGELISFYY